MTSGNDASAYKAPPAFDFNKAVADLRRDYPEATRNVTFIDSSRRDAVEQLAAWYKEEVSAEYRDSQVDVSDWENKNTVRNALYEAMHNKGGAFSAYDPASGKSLVVAHGRADTLGIGIAPGLPKQSKLAFVFNHEAGHVLLKNGIFRKRKKKTIPNDKALRITRGYEISADTFAVLRGFKQGWLERRDMDRLVRWRDNPSLQHETASALLALAEKHAPEDMVSRSPREIMKMAERHARQAAHPPRRIFRFIPKGLLNF
jgi:hypothetical protein